METLALLAGLAVLVLLVSYIWLTVVAFRQSVLWGVLVLLLSPFAAIIFAVKYWFYAKKPFLIYIVSFTLYFTYFGYMFVQMGGTEMLEMAGRIERGELSEDDALNFMQDAMDRMESSWFLDDQEKLELARVQAIFDELNEESRRGRADSYDPYAANWAARSSPRAPEKYPYERPKWTYQDVPLSGLTKFINAPIRVFDRQGREHNVTLLGMDARSLKLRMNVGAGSFDFALPTTKIERVQALTPAPT